MPNYLAPGVYVEEVSSGSKPIEGVGTAVGAFIGFAEKGPVNEPVLVTNWTQFTQTFGGFVDGAHLAHSVYGYFLNGGGRAYVVRVGAERPRGAVAQLPTGADTPPLTLRALPGVEAEISVAVEESTKDTFKLVVKKAGKVEETHENLSTRKGPGFVVTALRQRSKLIEVEEQQAGKLAAPVTGTEVVLAHVEAAPAVSARDYIGDAADRTGFAGLEAIDDVTMLCAPDLMAAHQRGLLDDDGVKAVQEAMIAHCELMSDRVAILDSPKGLNAQQVRKWRTDFAGYDSKYAAMYWPWVKVVDPLSGKTREVPPSGHLAGIWARSDATRGVHKAPANEQLRGVVALELAITKSEHDALNPIGLNCLRAFPGQGIRVWGARTLSSDPEWRYLNVRRLFNYVEKSILQGTNWVVFEPNDPKLWDSVKRTITMFLRGVWRDGALFGRTPNESFYVKCDEENNPQENRDNGILTVEIGIAPVKPAEFVVFRISQYAEGAGLEE
ncbi:phage tail sheath family protein [Allokutzneria sp. NRRL B-24872]|uniref:phage tail sheath family protein n=1 Tax=Allokutzneria sp. NRRL B-24872 TaxID=1137961 RepID=UPI000A3737DA|nr:phage tail sheath family protein [Allokutzneria sp. NRRL B-24872]